jgi:hypothetical protein
MHTTVLDLQQYYKSCELCLACWLLVNFLMQGEELQVTECVAIHFEFLYVRFTSGRIGVLSCHT